MRNFGKFTASPETITVPGLVVGIGENGEEIREADQSFNVLIFRDRNGNDLVDVARADPHPLYIAVDDTGLVRSMTDDVEQSQIAGMDIIGIDEDYGWTFGPGGTVYGKKWTGAAIVDPLEVMSPEERRAHMPDLEKWRVDTIIDLEPGLRERIDAAIDRWPEPKRTISKNKLKSVTWFKRIDPLFDDVGADPEVGKTPEDIDAMWMAGAALG